MQSEALQIGTLVATGVLVLVNIWLVLTTKKLAQTAEREFELARRSCVRAVEWRYDKNQTQRELQHQTWPIRFDIADMVGVPTLVESANIESYWNDRKDKAEEVHVPGIPTSIIQGSPVRVFVDRDYLMADAIFENEHTSEEEMRDNRRTRPPIRELIIRGNFTYVNTVDNAKCTVTFGATCRLIDESSWKFHIAKHPQTETTTPSPSGRAFSRWLQALAND